MVRKKLQFIYKLIISKLFQIIYGKIVFLNQNDNDEIITKSLLTLSLCISKQGCQKLKNILFDF